MSGGGAGDDGRRQAARSARTAGSSASAGSASEGLARPDDDWLWKTEEVQAVVRLLDRNDELTARVSREWVHSEFPAQPTRDVGEHGLLHTPCGVRFRCYRLLSSIYALPRGSVLRVQHGVTTLETTEAARSVCCSWDHAGKAVTEGGSRLDYTDGRAA